MLLFHMFDWFNWSKKKVKKINLCMCFCKRGIFVHFLVLDCNYKTMQFKRELLEFFLYEINLLIETTSKSNFLTINPNDKV